MASKLGIKKLGWLLTGALVLTNCNKKSDDSGGPPAPAAPPPAVVLGSYDFISQTAPNSLNGSMNGRSGDQIYAADIQVSPPHLFVVSHVKKGDFVVDSYISMIEISTGKLVRRINRPSTIGEEHIRKIQIDGDLIFIRFFGGIYVQNKNNDSLLGSPLRFEWGGPADEQFVPSKPKKKSANSTKMADSKCKELEEEKSTEDENSSDELDADRKAECEKELQAKKEEELRQQQEEEKRHRKEHLDWLFQREKRRQDHSYSFIVEGDRLFLPFPQDQYLNPDLGDMCRGTFMFENKKVNCHFSNLTPLAYRKQGDVFSILGFEQGRPFDRTIMTERKQNELLEMPRQHWVTDCEKTVVNMVAANGALYFLKRKETGSFVLIKATRVNNSGITQAAERDLPGIGLPPQPPLAFGNNFIFYFADHRIMTTPIF